MAIRNIVKEGDPILNNMRETMIAADGVGLAGPQVGMLRRLFVVWDTTDAPEEIPENYEYKFIDFVNPEILAVSEDEETAYEGCLSFPQPSRSAHRTATASGSSWKPRACWPAASSTRTTIWTASPSWSPASSSMRTPRRAAPLPPRRRRTTDAHSVHGDAGHCGGLPESPV